MVITGSLDSDYTMTMSRQGPGRSVFSLWHVGHSKIKAPAVHQRGDEGDAAAQAIQFRHQQGGLALLGQRHRGGQLQPVAALAAFDLDEFRDLLAVVAHKIAAHGFALRLDA